MKEFFPVGSPSGGTKINLFFPRKGQKEFCIWKTHTCSTNGKSLPLVKLQEEKESPIGYLLLEGLGSLPERKERGFVFLGMDSFFGKEGSFGISVGYNAKKEGYGQ